MNPTFLDLIEMWAIEKKYHVFSPKPEAWITFGKAGCWAASVWPSGYVLVSTTWTDSHSEFLVPGRSSIL